MVVAATAAKSTKPLDVGKVPGKARQPTSGSRRPAPLPLKFALRSTTRLTGRTSKAGTVCVFSASTDLCGGRSVMVVPTATRVHTPVNTQIVRKVFARARTRHTWEPTGERCGADPLVRSRRPRRLVRDEPDFVSARAGPGGPAQSQGVRPTMRVERNRFATLVVSHETQQLHHHPRQGSRAGRVHL